MQVPKTCVLPLDDAPSKDSYREALQRRLGNAWISMTTVSSIDWTRQVSSEVTFCQQRHTQTPHPLCRTAEATSCATSHDGQRAYTVGPLPDIHTTYSWLCQGALDILHDGKYRKTTTSRSLKHAAPKPSISPDSRHCPRMLVSFGDAVNSNLSCSPARKG